MRTLAAALLCCLVSTAASAELKYTVRLEARTVAASAPANPRIAALGQAILDAVVPGGSVEVTIIVGNGVARVEWSKALPGIPVGTVLIQRGNGTKVMVNTVDHTYWPAGMPDAYALGIARRPVVQATPAASPEIVAGIPTTRSSLNVTIPFQEARDGMMTTGTPTDLPLNGDVWLTDRYAGFATQELRPIHGLALLGLDVAPIGTLSLRLIVRGPLFGDVELESVVTAITEEDLPDALFELPAGFKQVAAPRIRR